MGFGASNLQSVIVRSYHLLLYFCLYDTAYNLRPWVFKAVESKFTTHFPNRCVGLHNMFPIVQWLLTHTFTMEKQHTSAMKALTSSVFRIPNRKPPYILLSTCWIFWSLVGVGWWLWCGARSWTWVIKGLVCILFMSSTAIECSTRHLRLRYGTVSMTSSYYGGIVTYVCSYGYKLSRGPRTRICSSDGIYG